MDSLSWWGGNLRFGNCGDSRRLTALPPAKPPFGRLRTENPDHFAAVYVKDHFMGHVDKFSNFAQTLALPPGTGTYEVKIVPVNGQGTVTKTVTLEADKTFIVK